MNSLSIHSFQGSLVAVTEFVVYCYAAAPYGRKLELIIHQVNLTCDDRVRAACTDSIHQFARSDQGDRCTCSRSVVDVVEVRSAERISISEPGEGDTAGKDAGTASQDNRFVSIDIPVETKTGRQGCITQPFVVELGERCMCIRWIGRDVIRYAGQVRIGSRLLADIAVIHTDTGRDLKALGDGDLIFCICAKQAYIEFAAGCVGVQVIVVVLAGAGLISSTDTGGHTVLEERNTVILPTAIPAIDESIIEIIEFVVCTKGELMNTLVPGNIICELESLL